MIVRVWSLQFGDDYSRIIYGNRCSIKLLHSLIDASGDAGLVEFDVLSDPGL